MAIYKIFAEKDSTIYSDYDTLNSGLDPILELTKNTSLLYPSQSTAARILIKFSDDDINNIITNYIGTSSYNCNLKLYLADATGLTYDYTIQAFPISGTWDMGSGQFGDSPVNTSGVSWKYMSANGTNAWKLASFTPGTTGSYTSTNTGGGTWYTSSEASQSFGYYTNKDINLNVTNAITKFVSGSIVNDGFVIKISGSLEFDEDYNFSLNYFGRDTNTVYPPILEFKWDDSSYNISASSISGVSNQDIRISIANNKGEFNQYEKYRFRLNVREQYPVRTYATSSLFTVQKYIPSSSYYSIKDVKSDITIVDFDDNYTKISADLNGNYFDVYMNGLEPERYYKILIKTVISGSTIIFDEQYFFKVKE